MKQYHIKHNTELTLLGLFRIRHNIIYTIFGLYNLSLGLHYKFHQHVLYDKFCFYSIDIAQLLSVTAYIFTVVFMRLFALPGIIKTYKSAVYYCNIHDNLDNGCFFDNDVRCVYKIVKSVEFVTFERTRNSETGENYKKK